MNCSLTDYVSHLATKLSRSTRIIKEILLFNYFTLLKSCRKLNLQNFIHHRFKNHKRLVTVCLLLSIVTSDRGNRAVRSIEK